MQIALGITLGVLIALTAYRLGALSVSGVWAAVVVGGLIFGLGGIPWATLLLIFFISSSLLSRAKVGQKEFLHEKYAKGSRRDYGQVLANGGLGAVLVLVYRLYPDLEWLWIAFAGSIAAVNADTWATELGVLSSSPPRLITNGRVVEKGTSGGVTLTGYLSSLAGAGIISIVTAVFTPSLAGGWIILFVVCGGLVGVTVDSILGSTLQGIFYCSNCQKETESHPVHYCGKETKQIRGWRWFSNDIVNLVCAFMGAAVAVGMWGLFL